MYTLKSFATVADKKTIKEVNVVKNVVEVAEKMADQIVKDAINNPPYNVVTESEYNGRNRVDLMNTQIEHNYKHSAWATFKQWSDKGFRIKKGEHGVTVFCGFYEVKDSEDDKKAPKFARVFNRDQVQAITDKLKEEYLTQ